MEIPSAIRDAITAVRSMGERYLCVDALCIPQNDFVVEHFQIAHMAMIYTSAVLTLVAASGKDAGSRLLGVQTGSRWSRPWGSEAHLNRPARPDLILKAIERSLYNSRAWTFQERHLSRRLMCFPVLIRPGRPGLLVEIAHLSRGRRGSFFWDRSDFGTAPRMDHHTWVGGTVLRLGFAVDALKWNTAKVPVTVIFNITFSNMVLCGLGWTRLL